MKTARKVSPPGRSGQAAIAMEAEATRRSLLLFLVAANL